MMSYKENITPGEWKVLDRDDGPCIGMGSYLKDSPTFYAKHRWDCADDDPDALDDPECEANAQLIAEAGTVTNETGKTPRELQQERDEALAALLEIRERCGLELRCMEKIVGEKFMGSDHRDFTISILIKAQKIEGEQMVE